MSSGSSTIAADQQLAGAESLKSATWAVIFIPTASLGLRIWSRLTSTSEWKDKLGWDDFLAVAAWCCHIVTCAFLIWGLDGGLGHSMTALIMSGDTLPLKMLYIGQIIYWAGLAFTKFSVLMFHKRVFTLRQRHFKIAWIITFIFVIAFTLFTIPSQVLVCIPPKKYWDPTIAGTCTNEFTDLSMDVALLAIDVVTDTLILGIPMLVISTLKMNRQRKFTVTFVFILGYSVWAMSVARLVTTIWQQLANGATPWNQMVMYGLAIGEIATAVFTINLPPCFSLFRRLTKGGFKALFHSREVQSTPTSSQTSGAAATTASTGSSSSSSISSLKRFLILPESGFLRRLMRRLRPKADLDGLLGSRNSSKNHIFIKTTFNITSHSVGDQSTMSEYEQGELFTGRRPSEVRIEVCSPA